MWYWAVSYNFNGIQKQNFVNVILNYPIVWKAENIITSWTTKGFFFKLDMKNGSSSYRTAVANHSDLTDN
jgi:hypothetical protein